MAEPHGSASRCHLRQAGRIHADTDEGFLRYGAGSSAPPIRVHGFRADVLADGSQRSTVLSCGSGCRGTFEGLLTDPSTRSQIRCVAAHPYNYQ